MSIVFQNTINYIDGLPEEKKIQLLYKSIINEDNQALILKLSMMIEDLKLLVLNYVLQLLKNDDFLKQKSGLRIITYDKHFYNKEDLEKLKSLIPFIKEGFPERRIRSIKKTLLSSKEKEVWTCECKSTIEIGKHCGNCKKDIYGFTATEITPLKAISTIEEKINLISEFIE